MSDALPELNREITASDVALSRKLTNIGAMKSRDSS